MIFKLGIDVSQGFCSNGVNPWGRLVSGLALKGHTTISPLLKTVLLKSDKIAQSKPSTIICPDI